MTLGHTEGVTRQLMSIYVQAANDAKDHAVFCRRRWWLWKWWSKLASEQLKAENKKDTDFKRCHELIHVL